MRTHCDRNRSGSQTISEHSLYQSHFKFLRIHSALTVEANALATLDTSTQNLNALLPECVCRPRPHLELASDQACGPQTRLEIFRAFLFRESECDARCGGICLVVIHTSMPRVLVREVGQSSKLLYRCGHDGLDFQDDASGGGRTYQDARAKKRLVLVILNDLVGCARL